MKFLSGLLFGLTFFASTASAQNAKPTPVNVHNFVRAETDRYFGKTAIGDGAFGKLRHRREMASIDKQDVVRMNRDTLYSSGVFDLDASACYDHAARRRQAVHVDAGGLAGPLHDGGRVRTGKLHLHERQGRNALRLHHHPHAREFRHPAGRKDGERRAGRDQGGAGQRRQVRGAELGPGFADQGAGCA